MAKQETLVLIKPDGVQKNLVGTIISRFESSGLKVKAMKMQQPNEEITKKHYPLDEEWANSVFTKTKAAYEKLGKEMEYNNHLDLGQEIISRLCKFLVEGPIVAMILEGEDAISKVREIVGHTEPKQAEKGTIRGDLAAEESYQKADGEKRAVRNLVHASDSVKNANREIQVWFKSS
jgi:nucleoside-diphosphate kinase